MLLSNTKVIHRPANFLCTPNTQWNVRPGEWVISLTIDGIRGMYTFGVYPVWKDQFMGKKDCS